MRKHQKFFSVVRDGRQLPHFLGVADAREDARGFIRSGNERVLRARLEDARFFWDQDRKVPLAERAAGLRNVVFQEKLGTYDDKAQRLKKIVSYLCGRLEAAEAKDDAAAAAGLAKADLLTEMVREFPSLQGRMGGLYARAEGYPEGVARAVYEHYQPAGPGRGLAVVDGRGGPVDRRQARLDGRRPRGSASRSAARATPSACGGTPTASARSSSTASSASPSPISSTRPSPPTGTG